MMASKRKSCARAEDRRLVREAGRNVEALHFSEERQSDTNDVEVEHHILNPIEHFDAVVDTHENFQFDVEDLVSEDRDDSESSESNDDWNQDEVNWDEAFDDV